MTGEKMKRPKAPAFYPIHRKEFKWTIHPSPGPHPIESSLPIAIILREILGYASNLREVKYMLNKGYVKVDKRVIKDYRFPVGLMDILELVPEEKLYRMLPTPKMRVYPFEISREEANIKPLRVKVKMMVRGGITQFTFHDGRNLLEKDPEKACKIKPGDTLVYDLENKQILKHIPLQKGVLALVIGGSKTGTVGTIEDIVHPDKLRPKIVHLRVNGGTVQTIKDYIFPIGLDTPVIKLPEVKT